MADKSLKCPRCTSDNLEKRKLGVAMTAWEVTFGRGFGTKEEVAAYACQECGLVFLQLEHYPGQASDQAKAWADAEIQAGDS